MFGYTRKERIINFLAEASSLLFIPLMLLNTFGGIISGIWLAILGEWPSIGLGLGLAIGGPFLLSIPLGLSMLLMAPAVYLLEKVKNILLQVPIAACGLAVTFIIMIAWCYLCMSLLLEDVYRDTLWPMLLWTYGAVTAPFVYMAQKDQQAGGNEYSVFTLFFYQIGVLLNMIVIGFFDFDIEETVGLFVGVMSLALLVQVGLVTYQMRLQSSGLYNF